MVRGTNGIQEKVGYRESMNIDVELNQREPWRWVELASQIADGAVEVDHKTEMQIRNLPSPRIQNRETVREAFWELLSKPLRHVGITWLDRMGILGEILPCWNGLSTRRKLRLDALEEVHKESWKDGLSEKAFQHVCDTHDVVVDGRLNRWALTALGTLLAGGDTENQIAWAKQVRRDLHALGATEAEILWVEGVVIDYRKGIRILRGLIQDSHLSPALAVACMSTMKVGGEDSSDEINKAVELVNHLLEKEAGPLA